MAPYTPDQFFIINVNYYAKIRHILFYLSDCCHERLANSESLERLRNSWLGVREDIRRLYNLVLCDAWNDPNRFEERPDLNVLKETLSDLIRTDGHCLFQRLEAIVTEFVLEMKARVLDVLQKSSSQDFLSGKLFFILDNCIQEERVLKHECAECAIKFGYNYFFSQIH